MGQNNKARRASKARSRQQRRASRSGHPAAAAREQLAQALGIDTSASADVMADLSQRLGLPPQALCAAGLCDCNDDTSPGAGTVRGGSRAGRSSRSDLLTAREVEGYLQHLLNNFRVNSPTYPELLGDICLRLATAHPKTSAVVDRVLTTRLGEEVRAAWARGWQPGDLLRARDRDLKDPLAQGILLDAQVADLATYAPSAVHPDFATQLREADGRQWWDPAESYLQARARQSSVARLDMIATAVTVIATLDSLIELPPVCSPPGQYTAAAQSQSQVDQKILERVRQLLAKAESTTFEAEAETFTLGAQSLMARHRIDAAMLAASQPQHNGPGARRIYVDAPYEDPKCSLLTVIADTNGCRSVWLKQLGFVSVVGFEADLLAVETLFTSLLVQATAAMHRHGSQTDRSGRSRTRAFRSSFLAAYAHRIGQRLGEAVGEEVARADREKSGPDLLPVLAARDAEVEEAFEALFPHTQAGRARTVRDARGWYAGQVAADQAALQHGPALG